MNDNLLNTLLIIRDELANIKSCNECPIRATCDACCNRGMENLCILIESMLEDVKKQKE